MTATPPSLPPPARSAFVTVVAWIFIALSGFGVAAGILQNLMLHLLFPLERMRQQMQAETALPAAARFLFDHIEGVFALALLASAAMLAASIGLLRRHDGARRLFVGLLLLGIAWNIGVTVFQQVFLVQSMAFAGMHEVPDEMHAQMQRMLVFFRVFGIGVAVVMSALLGWIAWRLCTPVVAAEFRRAG